MPRKKNETKEITYKLDMQGYLLYRSMLVLHDEFRGLDSETQEKLSDFVYYLGQKYEPTIEDGFDIDNEELYLKYELSK